MCGPTLAWDWLVLDIAFVLVLLVGSAVLRARAASRASWALFGLLSALAGAALLGWTYHVQAAAAAPASDAALLFASC